MILAACLLVKLFKFSLTSVALQFPDLAAQQHEHAVKQLGLRGAAIGGHVAGEALSAPTPPAAAKPVAKPAVPAGFPERALKMLEYVDKHGDAPDGYEGGRTFGNFERRLPLNDAQGRRIKYREWDVNPLRSGVNRGPERLVTGSDGSAQRRFRPDVEYVEDNPLPSVRAPHEREFCLSRLALIATAI